MQVRRGAPHRGRCGTARRSPAGVDARAGAGRSREAIGTGGGGASRAREGGPMHADVIVVGAGLAGLVATAELAAAGRRVILLEQEPEASLGGQAFWSFGGLFLVDS